MSIYDWILCRCVAPKVFAELRCGVCHPLALNVNVNIQTLRWKWFRLQLNRLLKSQRSSAVLGASNGKTDLPGKMNSSSKTKPTQSEVFFALTFLDSTVSKSGSVTVSLLLQMGKHLDHFCTCQGFWRNERGLSNLSKCSIVFQVTQVVFIYSPVSPLTTTDKN